MIKPLHKRLDFIASILIPTAIAIGIAVSILLTESPRGFCFTSDCYQNFLSLYKIPLATLALAFPLAGIVAAYHRSIETNEQIKIAQTNNTFSNYIKHREDFLEHIEEHLGKEETKYGISDIRNFYRLLFPHNNYSYFDPSLPDSEKNFLLLKFDLIKMKVEELSICEGPDEGLIFELYVLIRDANQTIGLKPHQMNNFYIGYKDEDVIGPFVATSPSPLLNIDELLTIGNRIRTLTGLPNIEIPNWRSKRDIRISLEYFTREYRRNNDGNAS